MSLRFPASSPSPRRLVSLAASVLVLASCTMGPDFKAPEGPQTVSYLVEPQTMPFVAAGIPNGEAQRIVEGLDIPGQWWEVFQSSKLDGLIRTALVANPDIKAASAALKVAQANARVQRSSLFPTVAGTGGAAANQVPTFLSAPLADGTNYNYSLYTLGLTVTYNLDLWGANRRQIESLEALAEAQCFQLEGAYLSLASNVVAAAILEASLRAQIESTEQIIAAQRDTLDILNRQSGLGAVTGADVAAQQAQLAQLEATLPPLQKALAQQRNLMATLLGRLPSEGVAEQFKLTDLKLPDELPLSLPSRLVEQRPDVRAAEANLHSSSALVGVATANQFPNITLNASIATQALTAGALFGPAAPAAIVGASLLQTIFDGGALAAKKRAAVAGLEQADAQYRSVVLQAFRNVADVLRALEYDALALRAAVAAEQATATSLDIARRRLQLGDTTYVFVLTAELAYRQAALVRVQAQAARYSDVAALFQALGGGWWNREAAEGDKKAWPPRCRPPVPVQKPKA
jgi:NodT family efflux transporter outer membrane factor (OMF) lipoprotein